MGMEGAGRKPRASKKENKMEIPTVYVSVRGGIADPYKSTGTVRVIVQDYDIETYDEADLKTDDFGNQYRETVSTWVRGEK